jgi:hypothetical protein
MRRLDLKDLEDIHGNVAYGCGFCGAPWARAIGT